MSVEDGLQCIICLQQREYFCVSSCDHAICLTCVIRIMMLKDSKECPVCRVVMEKVIAFVGDEKKKTKFVEVLNIPHVTGIRYEEKGIFFTNQELKQFADNLLSHVCQICENRMVFPTFRHLEVHMRHQHERFSCDICTVNLTLFSEERQFFTRVALARHRRIGDDKKLGERGHPLCKFCDERYFDADMLFRHCRTVHHFCHFCSSNKMNDFFPTLDALKDHFRSSHFFCEIDNCANEPYGVVFENKVDYQCHLNSNHSETMGRYFSRENRHLLELHGEFQQDWHAGSKRRSRRLEALIENKQKGIQQQPSVQQSFHLENEDFPNLNPNIASSSGVQSNNNYSSTAVTKNWKKSKEVVPFIDDFPPLSSSSSNAPVVVDDTADKRSPWCTVNGNKRKGKEKCDFSKGGRTDLLSHTSLAAAKANSDLMKNQHLCSTSPELADAEQMFRNDNTSDHVKKAEQPASQYENEFPELPVKDSNCNSEPWIEWSFPNKLSKQVAAPKKEPGVLKNLKANQPSEAHQSRSKTKFLLEPIEEKHNEAGSSKTKAKNAKAEQPASQYENEFPELPVKDSLIQNCNSEPWIEWSFPNKLSKQVAAPKKEPGVLKNLKANQPSEAHQSRSKTKFLLEPIEEKHNEAGSSKTKAKNAKMNLTMMNCDADFPPLVNENSMCNTTGMPLLGFKGKLQFKSRDVVKIDVTVNETQKMPNNADMVEFPSLPGSKDVHTAGNVEYSAKTNANYSAAVLKVQNGSSTAKFRNAEEQQQMKVDELTNKNVKARMKQQTASLNEDTAAVQSPFHAQHDSMKLEQKNTNKSGAYIEGKKFKDKAGLRSNGHKQVQGKSSQKSAKGSNPQASRVKWDSEERMKKEAKSNCFNFFLHVKYPEFYEKCLPYIENRSGKKWKSGEFLKLSQYEEQSANLRGRLVASMSDNELASFENLLNNFQEGKMIAGDFFSEMMHQLGEGLFLSVFPEMISLMPNVDMQRKLLRCYITHCVNCGEDLQVRFQSVDLCHICSQVVMSVNYMQHVRLHCEEEEL
ncbi:Zinc finger protein [Trichinella sp. T6]|nr:Zinc finger protein [Trichinella sp. T6]